MNAAFTRNIFTRLLIVAAVAGSGCASTPQRFVFHDPGGVLEGYADQFSRDPSAYDGIVDIVVARQGTNLRTVDLYWIRLPCQNGAAISVSEAGGGIAVVVEATPPPPDECPAEGMIDAVRLLLDRDTDIEDIDASLSPARSGDRNRASAEATLRILA